MGLRQSYYRQPFEVVDIVDGVRAGGLCGGDLAGGFCGGSLPGVRMEQYLDEMNDLGDL